MLLFHKHPSLVMRFFEITRTRIIILAPKKVVICELHILCNLRDFSVPLNAYIVIWQEFRSVLILKLVPELYQEQNPIKKIQS